MENGEEPLALLVTHDPTGSRRFLANDRNRAVARSDEGRQRADPYRYARRNELRTAREFCIRLRSTG